MSSFFVAFVMFRNKLWSTPETSPDSVKKINKRKMFHDVKSVAMPLFRLVIKEIIWLIIKFDNGDHENSSCYQLSRHWHWSTYSIKPSHFPQNGIQNYPTFSSIHCFHSGLYKFADLTNQMQYKVFLDWELIVCARWRKNSLVLSS